jgi:NAD-dependent dihydropyrimidine dehydrogenase PreA subunit
VSRVHLVRVRPGEAAAAVSDKAGRVLAAALADAGSAVGAVLRYRYQEHVKRRSEEQFLGWLSPVLAGLRADGRSLELQPEATEAAGERRVAVPDGAPVSLSALVAPDLPLLLCLRPRLHKRSGLAGALQRAAVACASMQGRSLLVEEIQPYVDRALCGGCGLCVVHCGNDGVRHNGHVAVIRPENCLACGDCLADCETRALRFPAQGGDDLQRRLARAAAAVLADPAPRVFLAFLLKEPERHAPNLLRDDGRRDVGVLAASDPVALDRVLLDLLAASEGGNALAAVAPDTDPSLLITEAARLGAGFDRPVMVEHR